MPSSRNVVGGFGNLPATINRLRAVRNRLAGAITQVLNDEARDCSHWGSSDRFLAHEKAALEQARQALLTLPPQPETQDERIWRASAREDFARIEGERTHGEPYGEHSPNVR